MMSHLLRNLWFFLFIMLFKNHIHSKAYYIHIKAKHTRAHKHRKTNTWTYVHRHCGRTRQCCLMWYTHSYKVVVFMGPGSFSLRCFAFDLHYAKIAVENWLHAQNLLSWIFFVTRCQLELEMLCRFKTIQFFFDLKFTRKICMRLAASK